VAPDELPDASLAGPKHPLTKAILQAFERADWDDLAKQTGDLRMGLARLAAGAAWTEQQRNEQPNEDARRHREARHRASLSLVANHMDEWRELMRTHRAEIDAERDAENSPDPGAGQATPGPKTARNRRHWLDRIKAAARRSAD
jgi:hypothetical protein